LAFIFSIDGGFGFSDLYSLGVAYIVASIRHYFVRKSDGYNVGQARLTVYIPSN